jgi:hypothetical protein
MPDKRHRTIEVLVSPAFVGQPRASVIVIGAGAFGGWSALQLLRKGAKVILLDAWGPGNSSASSGGETRVIRTTYGPERLYTQMATRALELWQENEQRWNLKLFFRVGSCKFLKLADCIIVTNVLPPEQTTLFAYSRRGDVVRLLFCVVERTHLIGSRRTQPARTIGGTSTPPNEFERSFWYGQSQGMPQYTQDELENPSQNEGWPCRPWLFSISSPVPRKEPQKKLLLVVDIHGTRIVL